MISCDPHLPGRFKEASCSNTTTQYFIKDSNRRRSTTTCSDFGMHAQGGDEKDRKIVLGTSSHDTNLIRR